MEEKWEFVPVSGSDFTEQEPPRKKPALFKDAEFSFGDKPPNTPDLFRPTEFTSPTHFNPTPVQNPNLSKRRRSKLTTSLPQSTDMFHFSKLPSPTPHTSNTSTPIPIQRTASVPQGISYENVSSPEFAQQSSFEHPPAYSGPPNPYYYHDTRAYSDVYRYCSDPSQIPMEEQNYSTSLPPAFTSLPHSLKRSFNEL